MPTTSAAATEMPPVVLMVPPAIVTWPAVRAAVPTSFPELVIVRELAPIASVAPDWLRVSAPIVSLAFRVTVLAPATLIVAVSVFLFGTPPPLQPLPAPCRYGNRRPKFGLPNCTSAIIYGVASLL